MVTTGAFRIVLVGSTRNPLLAIAEYVFNAFDEYAESTWT